MSSKFNQKSVFLLLIILLTTVFIFISYLNRSPFQITEDMVMESGYTKRRLVNPIDSVFTSIIRYDTVSARILNSTMDRNLVEIRCSDELIRTDQGVYVLKTIKTSQKGKKRIKNEEFIEFMRNKEKNLTEGKKILSVRVCETADKSIYVFYSVGFYDIKNADNSPILQTIYNSVNNDAYIQMFSRWGNLGNRLFTIAKSNTHLLCNEPFQLTTNNRLYVLCNEELYKHSNHFIYEINLNSGSAKVVGKCLNDYSGKLKTVCD